MLLVRLPAQYYSGSGKIKIQLTFLTVWELEALTSCVVENFKDFTLIYLFIRDAERERDRDIGRGRSRLPVRT